MRSLTSYRFLLAGMAAFGSVLVVACAIILTPIVRENLEGRQEERLRVLSQIALRQLSELDRSALHGEDPRTREREAGSPDDRLATWCREFGADAGVSLRVYSATGALLAMSNPAPGRLFPGAEATIPEGSMRAPTLVRRTTDGSESVSLFVPIGAPGGQTGVVELTSSSRSIREAIDQFHRGLLTIAVVALFLGLLTLFYLTRRIDREFERIQSTIDSLGRLDSLDRRSTLPDLGISERWNPASAATEGVIRALKATAGGWNDRMRLLSRRCAEQDALLASMVECVIAIDPDGRIISLNPAAGRFLGLAPEEAIDRRFQEVARHVALNRFVTRTLRSEQLIEEEIDLDNGKHRCIRAQGTTLEDAHGLRSGALIVLEDVTHLRRLETVRKDFVANVSHELKTPITSIKGFAETLHDGALDDPEEARRFVAIIHKQSNRLQAIIEDLLSLSRIEQEGELGGIELSWTKIGSVLDLAIQTCSGSSESKEIELRLECDPELEADVNAPLIEQAAVNLIDNAIKYSGLGTTVTVAAFLSETDPEILIEVRDQGPGIEKKHVARLFERFYRVDKARSRKLGGTGLGLAIVKHIALAHAGRVSVESRLGEGSTFRLHLPGP